MSVYVIYEPFFRIAVYNYTNEPDPNNQVSFKVWATTIPAIYYTFNGTEKEDYAIIQAIEKPGSAKYIGFGEQGGKALCKNEKRVNYFNFDNMRYRQVYDKGPLDDREPLYHSDPFFLEFNGVPNQKSVYGIHIDNPSQVLVDIGYDNSGRYMFGTRFGDFDYYFFLGNKAADIVSSFTSIVGRSPLKPRYVLGYHQGCYGYEKGGDMKWVVDKYRQHKIPLDGLHIDVDIQNKYQTFTIKEDFPDVFSNAQEMFVDLRLQGVKCSTNITPIISNQDPNYKTYKEGLDKAYFVLDRRVEPDNGDGKQSHYYEGGRNECEPLADPENNFNSGNPYIGQVYYGGKRGTTGHYPDLGRVDVRKWWGEQYKEIFEMGLEFVWQDMTTPAIAHWRGDMKGFPFRLEVTDDFFSDVEGADEAESRKTPALKVWNLFSYNLHKATYNGLNRLPGRENKRNFIIGRGSFTGMHRFAGLWTGDNSSSWDFLKMNVAQVISLGMCGMSICGQDIGGFEAEDNQRWAGPELIMRWTAVGAFLPWFRNHYIRKGQKEFQEPFMYVDWFDEYNKPLPDPEDQYRMVLPVCKYYIELRYRLLQLFYDAMFENSLSGIPICRAMFLNDPDDKALYNDKIDFLNDQFFVGRDLLVAPILDEQNMCGGKRDVYLPETSDWYCFKNNQQPLDEAVEGGITICEFDARFSEDPNHINFILPIYVRAGAIIPTVEVEQYVGERKDNREQYPDGNPITINIYPGDQTNTADGEERKIDFRSMPTTFSIFEDSEYDAWYSAYYTMYLDDGVSRSSAPSPNELPGSDEMGRGEYRKVEISHRGYSKIVKGFDDKTRIIEIKRTHDNYQPFEKYFFVAILHDPSEVPQRDANSQRDSSPLQKVSIGEKEIPLIKDGTPEERANQLSNSENNGWYYNEKIDISFLKVFDDNASIKITAEYR